MEGIIIKCILVIIAAVGIILFGAGAFTCITCIGAVLAMMVEDKAPPRELTEYVSILGRGMVLFCIGITALGCVLFQYTTNALGL